MDILRLKETIEAGEYDIPVEEVAEALLAWLIPTAPEEAPEEGGAPPQPLPSEQP